MIGLLAALPVGPSSKMPYHYHSSAAASMAKRYSRGTPVTATCTFDGAPSEVFFAYVRPGARNAIIDPGSESPGTRIAKRDDCTYSYTIDTSGMSDGIVQWRMWSEEGFVDDHLDQFAVGDEPHREAIQLIDETSSGSQKLAQALESCNGSYMALRRAAYNFAVQPIAQASPRSSYELLGFEVQRDDMKTVKHVAIGIALGILAVLLLRKS